MLEKPFGAGEGVVRVTSEEERNPGGPPSAPNTFCTLFIFRFLKMKFLNEMPELLSLPYSSDLIPHHDASSASEDDACHIEQ